MPVTKRASAADNRNEIQRKGAKNAKAQSYFTAFLVFIFASLLRGIFALKVIQEIKHGQT
jgi:hypothetical protein